MGDKVWLECEKYAKQTNNLKAYNQYHKKQTEFGTIIRILNQFHLIDSAYFRRYPAYRVWSRWEKVIFLSNVPEKSLSIEDTDHDGQVNDSDLKGVKFFHPSFVPQSSTRRA